MTLFGARFGCLGPGVDAGADKSRHFAIGGHTLLRSACKWGVNISGCVHFVRGMGLENTCSVEEKREFVAEKVARAWVGSPRALIVLLIAIAVAAAVLLPRLVVDAGLSPYRNQDDPLVTELNLVSDAFVGDDNLFIVYEKADVFAPAALSELRELGYQIEEIRVANPSEEQATLDDGGALAIADVTSLATVKIVEGRDASFRTPSLVPEEIPTDAAAIARIRANAYQNALVRDSLVSQKGDVAVLVARLDDSLTYAQRASAVADIRELLSPLNKGFPSYLLTGKAAVEVDEGEYTITDLKRFLPIAYLIILVLLVLYMRRLASVALGIIGVTLSIGLCAAMVPLLGGSLNSTSVMLPPVIGALTSAMLIHYFSEVGKHGRENPGADPARVAQITISQLLAPSLIAALTTSVGFIANAVSDMPAIRQFGIAMGIGVIGALIIVNALFALAARYLPAEKLNAPNSIAMGSHLAKLLSGLAEIHIKYRFLVLTLSLLVIGVGAAGIPKLVFGMDKLGSFDPETPIRRATAKMEQNVGGTSEMIIAIRHREEGHFNEPEVLHKLENLERFIESDGGAGADSVLSSNDYIKMMFRGFNNGDPAMERIPDNRRQVAAMFMINGDPKLREYIDANGQWVRLVARVSAVDSNITAERFKRVDDYLAKHFSAAKGYVQDEEDPSVAHISGALSTGGSKVFSTSVNRLAYTLVDSFILAFLVIFALLFVLFRSVRTGLVSIPVNLLPVLANLGLMGWLSIRLDAATVMISSVCIGIAVDDTVHFLQYLRGRLREHGDLELGVRETLSFKGSAVVGTTVVISAGFAVVLFSNFATARHFGLLVSTGVLAALFADLVLLPSILLCTRTRLGTRRSESLVDSNVTTAMAPVKVQASTI